MTQSHAGARRTTPDNAARDALRELSNAVAGEVRADLHNRMLYSTDASLYQVEPIAVVIPANVEDAIAAVDCCSRLGFAVLPRGGGTSLAGQCTNHAVVIDLSPNCRGVGPVDRDARRVTVEPGVTIDDLNDQIASSGLFFAPDPATSRHAAIGGCIGNNAAGARSIRYGRTSENVHSIDAAMVRSGGAATRVSFGPGAAAVSPIADGVTRRVCEIVARHADQIRERFPKTVRRNAGYGLDMVLAGMESAGWRGGPVTSEAINGVNIAHLLCGSEGTLAVTLGATLRLQPRPKAKGLAVLAFDNLDAAIAAVVPILTTNPSAVELLDDMVLDLARENTEYRRYVELMPTPASPLPLRAVLYVEYFAEDMAGVRERFSALAKVQPGVASAFHTDAGAMLNAWKLRKAGEPLLHGIPGHRKPLTFIEDNAIPVEHLSQFVKELRKIVDAEQTRAAYWAHASVGVLHVRPLLDIHDETDRARMHRIAVKTADLARSLGGVMSGEHGDGRVRGPLLERFYGPQLMNAFREIKAVFDPSNLLNPGNIVSPGPVESITTSLRVQPQERPVAVPPGVATYFDYSDEHGFDGAVEMCNGAGVCRKKQGGTMCPSYQATLDERHSTRGRGNALRLAITGQLATGEAAWEDAGTLETLDLCLSCKACKTECPSNVDIARLKAEYTAQGFKRGAKPPLATRLLASARWLNRLGSLGHPLSDRVSRWAPVRAIMNAALGMHPKRSLPPFSRSLAALWSKDSGVNGASAPKVVLFGDCFSMYSESGIGLAIRRVYEAFGYDVQLADAGCCSRPSISLGLLERGCDEADETCSRLHKLATEDGVRAILFAEPSCLSAVKDDWLSLRSKIPRAERARVAAKSFLAEDFLARHWDQHPHRAQFDSPGRVLLHGHCHQKALWGVETSAALLRRVFGSDLVVLDTGCCGMAGAFGMAAHRYDLSMKIGELSLFPAVRANPDAIVAAPGASCRHQVHDGVPGREALHPMEILARCLRPEKQP